MPIGYYVRHHEQRRPKRFVRVTEWYCHATRIVNLVPVTVTHQYSMALMGYARTPLLDQRTCYLL